MNVSPVEVDAVLLAHPALADAASLGVPDPVYGEEVIAFAVWRAGAQTDEASILSYCAAKLPVPKRPKRIVFIPELPKSERGKVLRDSLRSEYLRQISAATLNSSYGAPGLPYAAVRSRRCEFRTSWASRAFILWFDMPVLRTITLGFLLAVLSQTAWAKHADTAHKTAPSRPVLLELFTSQGCSDCPAADRMVTELANRNDVIALSLPITYWDILGWKDTFATDANTRRQKSYAQIMNRSGIYTPQMIIDGRLDVVGNQRDRVIQAVEMRSGAITRETSIPILLRKVSNRIEIAIPGSAKGKGAGTIWVMRTLAQGSVNVGDGENRNRQLTYTNLVRDLQRAGEWSGQSMKIDLPLNVAKLKYDGVVVILQAEDFGPVLGAAELRISGSKS